LIPVVTAREMGRIDEETIRDHVSGRLLMERAGAGVREEIAARWKPARQRKVVVVCGRGNNGGDGFVVARLLKRDGYSVKAYLLGKASDAKGDAGANLKRARTARITVKELGPSGLKAFEDDLAAADLVVDAIFGTGLEGETHGLAAEVIEAINRCPAPKVAIDIPSGVNATTGESRLAVEADVTVALGLPKRGHMLFPGKAYAGDVVLADIGIPDDVVDRADLSVFAFDSDDIRAALPVRPPEAHKWSCGHVACIAGSPGFTGAAALTAHSALRAGAGLVTLAIPRSLSTIMEIKLTEVMTLAVDETPAGSLALSSLGALKGLAEQAHCVAIGPGLSRHEDTTRLVRKLVPTLGKPCVLDADGINAFAGHAAELGSLPFPLVLTPHAGEAARLFGVDKADIMANRVDFAAKKARELGVVLVLKGAPTVVAGPAGDAYINPTGNQGLATAGSGDVLTGTIAGLLAQGLEPLAAAYCGVCIHGICGDLLLVEKGHFGYLAGELADKVPEAIASILTD
jgi:ADP-dependent NAD(P)H-hydrate dehydratase / NAD(P)H-hydrate epimerase